jgi:hypothetical protein
MAGRGAPTFQKRQKEQKRKEKQQQKDERRAERKQRGESETHAPLELLTGPVIYEDSDDLDREAPR